MDSGLYAACAGLMARTSSLDTIASNLANVSSAGFRGQTNIFGTVLAEARHHGKLSAVNAATNSYGVLAGTQMNYAQGAITRTGNDLDVALEGPGYLKVKTSHGIAYTRNGSLQVAANGALCSATGDTVLGQGGSPIVLGPGKVSISPDGTVSSGGAIAGRLDVTEFPASVRLVNRGNGYYEAPGGSGSAGSSTSLRQGSLEGSNVSAVDGVVSLIDAQRSAEGMRHVLTLLDSERDKTAVQDLPRVNNA